MAAKPPLTALCNSRAPPAVLGRQESVCRVVVCKSVAGTHAVPHGPVPPWLDQHNCTAEVRCRNWGTRPGPMRQCATREYDCEGGRSERPREDTFCRPETRIKSSPIPANYRV